MRFKRMVPGVIVCGILAVAAMAAQRREPPAEGVPAYRVTKWPVNSPDRPYLEDVERYLNQMAAEGWKLHGDLAGQGAKMFVFERATAG